MKARWDRRFPSEWTPNLETLLCDSKRLIPSLTRSRLQILLSRGLDTPEKAALYLKSYSRFAPSDFFDPRGLPDFLPAAERVLRAMERKETVLVFGDYDVDGITSIALLVRFFRQYAPEMPVHYRQPSRFKEGYGFGPEGVNAATSLGATLIITVDCGITAFETVDTARTAGIDVIILDHHEMKSSLPRAVAVVDPKRSDWEMPFRDWAAAGVVFSFICGLTGHSPERFPEFKLAPWLELATVGTIVDMAPLTGENRLIAKAGFLVMDTVIKGRKGCNKGLWHLRKLNGIDGRPLVGRDFAFILGPRLNAASRVEEAVWATELLLEEDDTRAAELAKKLEELNRDRKKTQNETRDRLTAEIRADARHRDHRLIVHASTELDEGVRGIIASQIAQEFHRPVLLFTLDRESGLASASGRSVGEFDLHGFMQGFPEFHENGGGHKFAVGIRVPLDAYPAFRERLLSAADERIRPEAVAPSLSIDAEILPEELNEAYAEFLNQLEPSGTGNPPPCLLLSRVRITSIKVADFMNGGGGYKAFLKFTILSSDEVFTHTLTLWDPTAFFGINSIKEFDPTPYLHHSADFVLKISKNEKNGRSFLNLNIVDFTVL
jgi:single-stranded-DNA-specific exonuclease